jgi:predicted PurR-regulated permease PerM
MSVIRRKREEYLAILPRVFIWTLIALLLYLLQSFSTLIFLTFVFSYIQISTGSFVERWIPGRKIRATAVALCLLGLLTAIGMYLIPQVRSQASVFVKGFPTTMKELDKNLLEASKTNTALQSLLPVVATAEPQNANWDPSSSPSALLLQQVFGTKNKQPSLKAVVDQLTNFGVSLLSAASAFLLALLFSFLIVLDLPALTAQVKSLGETKLSYIYHEVAPSLSSFGRVLGQALQAQLIIATLNMILTGIGLLWLGLGDKLAFLSLTVFLCSFIPVAGVVLSSIPICLLMMQKSGITGVLLTALLIWIIHMIEAYVLNPRIFGKHLRVNPVLVLIVLTVGGKLFHVWGLILGLPVCTYIFREAIQYQGTENKTEAQDTP